MNTGIISSFTIFIKLESLLFPHVPVPGRTLSVILHTDWDFNFFSATVGYKVAVFSRVRRGDGTRA